MSDPEGLRLLANHLAKVKLEAAEQIYTLTTRGKFLQQENEELNVQVLHLKQQCRENTLHWRLQERDDWKALVEAVQRDRTRLETENEHLMEEISVLRKQLTTLGHVPEAPTNSSYVSPSSKQKTAARYNYNNNNTDEQEEVSEDGNSRSPSYDKSDVSDHINHLEEELSKSKRRESALRDKLSTLKAQLEQWRIEKQTELESQIGALRLKLDKELEAKWERSQDKSILTSVFSNIIETIAPHPTITRRKSQIIGSAIEEMINDELNNINSNDNNNNGNNNDNKYNDDEQKFDSKNSPQV